MKVEQLPKNYTEARAMLGSRKTRVLRCVATVLVDLEFIEGEPAQRIGLYHYQSLIVVYVGDWSPFDAGTWIVPPPGYVTTSTAARLRAVARGLTWRRRGEWCHATGAATRPASSLCWEAYGMFDGRPAYRVAGS